MIRTPGEYVNLDELRNTVVAMRQGVPVRIREIASVDDTWRKVSSIVRVKRPAGIRLSVNKQSGTNTVEVARAVRAEDELVNRDIPSCRSCPSSTRPITSSGPSPTSEGRRSMAGCWPSSCC